MSKLYLFHLLLVMAFFSCSPKPAKNSEKPAAKPPEALQEHSASYDIISKRSGDDLVDALYQDAVAKTPALKELEEAIQSFDRKKADSLHDWYFFNNRNKTYYEEALRHSNNISDSSLKQAAVERIRKSMQSYSLMAKPYELQEEEISAKQRQLQNLREVLKLQLSIKAIEAFQKDLDGIQPLHNANKDLDQLLKRIHEITDRPIP